MIEDAYCSAPRDWYLSDECMCKPHTFDDIYQICSKSMHVLIQYNKY